MSVLEQPTKQTLSEREKRETAKNLLEIVTAKVVQGDEYCAQLLAQAAVGIRRGGSVRSEPI